MEHQSFSITHTVDIQGVPAVCKLLAGLESSPKSMLLMMDQKKDKILLSELRASNHVSNVPEEEPAATTITIGSCFQDKTEYKLHRLNDLVSPASHPI